MSAAQSQTTLESRLEALQCHFTWDLDHSRSRLFRLRDKLEDIGTEEGNSWLGHIYNLRGFTQYKLGFTEDAQSLFNKAAEAFCQTRGAHSDEGPWLVVNYGNLAWLHHHLGDQAESLAYLSMIDNLTKKYPPPPEDQLHPEVYAEKAWTLMTDRGDKTVIIDYFQRAIRMQPDMVEWNTSYVLALVSASKHSTTGPEDDVMNLMKMAKEQDPENLYLAASYLLQRAKKGERVEDEVRELAEKVLRNPVSSYSGMKTLLWFYRNHRSVDEAIDLAEEALRNHPDVRYLKRLAALCYRLKIIKDGCRRKSVIDRAVSLHQEVISLYPHSSLMTKLDLANIYAKSVHSQAEAEQIYRDLLDRDLDPAEGQIVYNRYANHVFFNLKDNSDKSIKYHMKAAEIPTESFFRENSIIILQKIKDRRMNRMWREIDEFLKRIQEPQCF